MRKILVLISAITLLATVSKAQDASLAGAFDDSIRGKSKWGFSYFSFTGVDAEPLYDGSATANIYNYVGANYKLSRDERINIRPAFSITTPGFNKYGDNVPGDVKMNDLYVNYANYSLALLPGDWELSGQYRVYFPTSKSTQEKKTIAYFHSWMVAEKLLGNGWGVQYNMRPTLWVQSQKAYRQEAFNGFINAKANQWGEYEHYVKLGKYLNSIFVPALEMGFVHSWYYTSSQQLYQSNASRNQLKIAPTTEIHINRDLWFILGMENMIDLNDTRIAGTWQDDRGRSINLFRPEDTQYYLMTFWTL